MDRKQLGILGGLALLLFVVTTLIAVTVRIEVHKVFVIMNMI